MEGFKKIGYTRNFFMNVIKDNNKENMMTGITLEGYYSRQDKIIFLVPSEEILKQGFVCGITLSLTTALHCNNKHYCPYTHSHVWERGITFVHYDPLALFSIIDELAELIYDEHCYRDSYECRTYIESRRESL